MQFNKFIIILLLSTGSWCQIQVKPLGQAAFNDALLMERRGDLEDARAVYESILETKPKNRQAYNRLKNVLKRIGDYEAAATLIENWLEHSPNDLQQNIELGEVYYLNGYFEASRNVWSEFVIQHYKSPSAYRLVAHTYSRLGLIEDMEILIRTGRKNFNQPAFMALDLGNYYQSHQDTENAVLEYLLYAKHNPRQKKMIMDKLLILSDDKDQIPVIENGLNMQLVESPELIHEFFTALYFKIGRYEESLHHQVALGKHNPEQWKRLNIFANSLRQEKQYNLSIQVYQLLLDVIRTQPDNIQINELGKVLLGLGQVYEDQIQPSHFSSSLVVNSKTSIFFPDINWNKQNISTASLEQALELYSNILTEFQTSSFSPNAHFRIGEIQYKILQDLDGARGSYIAALASNTDEKFEHMIHSRLIDVNISEGKIEDALIYLQETIPPKIKVANASDYTIKTIRSLLLNLEIDTVITILNDQIFRILPTDLHFNDFMEMQAILNSQYTLGTDVDKQAFITYLSAERLAAQQKFSESAEILSHIRNEYVTASITPFSSIKEIFLRLQMNQNEEALEIADWLQTTSAAAEGLILSGEISEYVLNDKESAVYFYQRFLNEQPQSIFIEPIRRHIRELRNTMEI